MVMMIVPGPAGGDDDPQQAEPNHRTAAQVPLPVRHSSLLRRQTNPADRLGQVPGQYKHYGLFVIVNSEMSESLDGVPAGSPSRGGDVAVYVKNKPTELACCFSFCSCVYFCLYSTFNCVPSH